MVPAAQSVTWSDRPCRRAVIDDVVALGRAWWLVSSNDRTAPSPSLQVRQREREREREIHSLQNIPTDSHRRKLRRGQGGGAANKFLPPNSAPSFRRCWQRVSVGLHYFDLLCICRTTCCTACCTTIHNKPRAIEVMESDTKSVSLSSLRRPVHITLCFMLVSNDAMSYCCELYYFYTSSRSIYSEIVLFMRGALIRSPSVLSGNWIWKAELSNSVPR